MRDRSPRNRRCWDAPRAAAGAACRLDELLAAAHDRSHRRRQPLAQAAGDRIRFGRELLRRFDAPPALPRSGEQVGRIRWVTNDDIVLLDIEIGRIDRRALLEEVELLAEDAASYAEGNAMRTALKELRQQQASIKLAIERLEKLSQRSPWVSPWPWIVLTMAVSVVLMVG